MVFLKWIADLINHLTLDTRRTRQTDTSNLNARQKILKVGGIHQNPAGGIN
jgi:hypothetical protein